MKRKITFAGRAGFHKEVKKRVNDYFESNGISKNANWRMVLKTALILSWLLGSYFLFLFSAPSLLWAVFYGIAIAQGFILVGFNIMHDGTHGSYSKNRRLNKVMGFTLDLIGGSALLWKHKHNILHHTYTNISEIDDDLYAVEFLRFTPDRPWKPIHRFQHFYAFPLYCFMTLGWVFEGDLKKYLSGKIGDYELPKLSKTETFTFFATKFFYFSYMLVLPMFFHPVLNVLTFFLVSHFILGLTMAVVFQLAHLVDGNDFPLPDPETGEIENEWAIHEVETTANFSPRSRLAAWYCGGLNFQIEHHLFPKVCHVHYPAISKIVEKTCKDFQVQYVSYPTFRSALKAHYEHLKLLGKPDQSMAAA